MCESWRVQIPLDRGPTSEAPQEAENKPFQWMFG